MTESKIKALFLQRFHVEDEDEIWVYYNDYDYEVRSNDFTYIYDASRDKFIRTDGY